MQIDDYANTAIRTIAGNAQVQGSIDRYEDAEQYLVWITDSPMECDNADHLKVEYYEQQKIYLKFQKNIMVQKIV